MMLKNGEMYLLHVMAFVFVFLEGDLTLSYLLETSCMGKSPYYHSRIA